MIKYDYANTDFKLSKRDIKKDYYSIRINGRSNKGIVKEYGAYFSFWR